MGTTFSTVRPEMLIKSPCDAIEAWWFTPGQLRDGKTAGLLLCFKMIDVFKIFKQAKIDYKCY